MEKNPSWEADSSSHKQETSRNLASPKFHDREICALLECYAAYCDSSLPTFRDNLSVPYQEESLEYGSDRLSRKVSKELPLNAA